MDSSIKGYKQALKEDPAAARQKAAEIVKNTYRTLMTRGQKGCYVFCTDPPTNEYFKQAAASRMSGAPLEQEAPYAGLPLPLFDHDDIVPFEDAVPVLDLKAAASDFSEEQWIEHEHWVKLPEPFTARPGYFVAQVVGQSMNRRVPHGSWCLFRRDDGGSREGKIVLVEHRGDGDPDAGRYTLKTYHSEKTTDGEGWRHARIILKPDSSDARFEPIVLEPNEAKELRVIGIFVAALG